MHMYVSYHHHNTEQPVYVTGFEEVHICCFVCYLLVLLFDPEDGRSMFPRKLVNYYLTARRHI
jgi:hypothetical protein